MMNELEITFRDICNEYLSLFCEKHDYLFDPEDVWVADNPGTVANICDLWVSFEDIRYDIDNNVPEEKFEQWYWKSLGRAEHKLKYMNYPSFCKGAPDPIPPEQLEKIRAAQLRLEEARKIFEESIKDYTYETF